MCELVSHTRGERKKGVEYIYTAHHGVNDISSAKEKEEKKKKKG